MTHTYRHVLRGPAVHDAVLSVAWLVVFLFGGAGGFRTFLLVGIPIVLVWGALTLHFPSRVELDDEGVAFVHYGRAHRFAWRDVARVHVRRFVVRDRVLVRIEPASAWRGRYWLLDSLEGFEPLMAALAARR